MPNINGTMGIFWRGIEAFFFHIEKLTECDQKEAKFMAAIKISQSSLLILGRLNVILDYMPMPMR